MSTSTTSTPHKPDSPSKNNNPFATSPLRRRAAPIGWFAFDSESLQRNYKANASPVKSPVRGAGGGKGKTPGRGLAGGVAVAKAKANSSETLKRREGDGGNREEKEVVGKGSGRAGGGGLEGGMNIFVPTKSLRRTPPPAAAASASTATTTATTAKPVTPRRSFGTTRSHNIPGRGQGRKISPLPYATTTTGGEKNMLAAALLERKRLLEGECTALKRKRDELKGEIEKETREGEEWRKVLKVSMEKMEMEMPSVIRDGGGGVEGGLDALIQSLLAANDSNLAVAASRSSSTMISTSTSTSSSLTSKPKPQQSTKAEIAQTEISQPIPSARPLPPPSNPNNPLYRSWCPFTFTSHTITILPSSSPGVPITDPPTTVTHHTLKGHGPHQLFNLRIEFDVARAVINNSKSLEGGKGNLAESTIISMPTTAISSHAQPELKNILTAARARANLLLALTALGEYSRLATLRAEAFGLLVRGLMGVEGVEVVSPVDYRLQRRQSRQQRRESLSKNNNNQKKKIPPSKRLTLLPYLGQKELVLKGITGRDIHPTEMIIKWELEFDNFTGDGRSIVSLEVVLPEGTSKAGGKEPRKHRKAGEQVVLGGALVKMEVEKVFRELVKEGGFVRAVCGVVGVVFGVEVDVEGERWEDGESGEEEEEEEEQVE